MATQETSTNGSDPSSYISSKTESLNSMKPVPPSEAKAAQIPLSSFEVPVFPPEASSLTSLILTSDINPSTYMSLLSAPMPTMPILPSSITSLTLELFTLGYPPSFLSTLSTALSNNLREFTAYAQLLCGTTPTTLDDSLQFFTQNCKTLESVHLIDVFAGSANFWAGVGGLPWPKLKFLEVVWTFRHDGIVTEDGKEQDGTSNFLKSLHAGVMGRLVQKGLVSLVIGLAKPDVLDTKDEDKDGKGEDEEDEEEDKSEGIVPVGGEAAEKFVKTLVKGEEKPKELMALDCTLFSLNFAQLAQITEVHRGLKVLAVTLEIGTEAKQDEKDNGGETEKIGESEMEEEAKSDVERLAEALKGCQELEQLEIVGCPSESWVEKAKEGKVALPSEEEIEGLGQRVTGLKEVKMSVLRTKEVVWAKKGGLNSEKWVQK